MSTLSTPLAAGAMHAETRLHLFSSLVLAQDAESGNARLCIH